MPPSSEVPPGTYRVVTTSPTDRFASFLATCKPRRVVNANPPWGAYQLTKGEKPLGASNNAGKVTKVKAYRKGKKRMLSIRAESAEKLTVGGSFITKGLGRLNRSGFLFKPQVVNGSKRITVRGPKLLAKRKVKINVGITLKDASGVKSYSSFRVTLPKVK